MNLATFGIAVDPTQAVTAAQTAVKAVESIGAAAERTQAEVIQATGDMAKALQQVGKSAQQSAQAAAAAGTQSSNETRKNAAAHESFSDKMAKANQRVTQEQVANNKAAASSWGNMIGHITGGLSQMAMMIPGTTGMVAGLAGGATQAATSLGSMTGALGPLGIALAALLSVLAAVVVPLGMIAAKGDEMAQAMGRLKAATGSVEKASAVYDVLYRSALKTGIAVDDSAPAFTRFAIAARGIGASAQDVTNLVDIIQKAGAVSGASTQEMSNASLQLAQALASGKLQGDELRSVLENMPILAEKMAKEMGTTIGGLRQMGEAGKLTSKNVFEAILKTQQQINKEFESLPPSLSRSWATVWTVFSRFLGDLDKAMGLSQSLATAIQSAAELFERFRATASGGHLGEIIGAEIQLGLSTALNFFFKSLVGGLASIPSAFMAAFTVLASGLEFLSHTETWSGMGKALLAVSADFGVRIMGVFQGIIAMIATKFEALIDSVRRKIPAALGGISSSAPAFDENAAYNRNKAGMDSYLAQTRAGVAALYKSAGSDLSAVWAELADRTKAAAASIVESFKSGYDAAGNFIPDDEIKKMEDKVARLTAMSEQAKKNSLLTSPLGPPQYTAPFITDAKMVENFQKEKEQILEAQRNGAVSPLESTRRIGAAENTLAGNLNSPGEYSGILGKWKAYNAEKEKIAAQTDERIKANGLSATAALGEGFRRAGEAFGNMNQQIVAAAGQLTNAISNGIGSALTDIATGAKDAKSAFRDMAVAILKSIADIIIQMLVQLAIGTAMKALGIPVVAAPASTGGAVGGTRTSPTVTATPSIASSPGVGRGYTAAPSSNGGLDMGNMGFSGTYEQSLGYASGGAITGGSGSHDDIPIMAMGGEYVLNKKAVAKYGLAYVTALNEGRVQKFADGGMVGPTANMANAGGSGSGNVNVQIHVDARGERASASSKTDGKGDQEKGEKMARNLEAVVLQVIQREKRPGGALAR